MELKVIHSWDEISTCYFRRTKFDWRLLKGSYDDKFSRLEFEIPSDAIEESKGKNVLNTDEKLTTNYIVQNIKKKKR